VDAFQQAADGSDGVKTVEIEITKVDGATGYELILPAGMLNSSVNRQIEIKTDIAAVTVPGNMLIAAEAAGQNVSLAIAAADMTKLSAEVQAQIGTRPVIELNLRIDGQKVSWSNENAPVTVSEPYTPTAEEMADPELRLNRWQRLLKKV